MIRSVIFDIDGTLLDSKRDIAGAQHYVLGKLGVHSYDPEDLYGYIGKPLGEIFRELLPPELHHRIPEATKMYVEYYRPVALETTVPFPGVAEVLGTLRERGIGLAVATTKSTETSRRVLEHFSLAAFFDQIQGSTPETPFKPDPYIVRKILGERNWEPSCCLMTGDSAADIGAGKSAGTLTCGVTYGSLDRTAIEALTPDYIIDEIGEIPGIVLEPVG